MNLRVASGRPFVNEDFGSGSEPVALIGHALWQERFSADPAVSGRIFRASLNDQATAPQSFRIIGVIRPDFRYAGDLSRRIDIVIPMRGPARVYMVRLRDGVPAGFAAGRLTEAARSAAVSIPPNWSGVQLESVRAKYVKGVRPVLLTITIAAGLMLVIVCANVAVLMSLRAARQQREVSVRVALGAARSHIFSMLATQSCLVCAAALMLGLLLTGLSLRLLAPLIEQHLGRPAPGGTSAIGVDATVVFAIGGVGILIILALSLLPLLSPWQRQLAEILRRDSRTGIDGPYMRRLRSSLIVFEIAGSLALLVGCGLMIRSALNLVRTDLGFETGRIVRARLALPARAYPDASALLAFYERFNDRLQTELNTRAALTNWPPFYPTPLQRVEIEREGGSGIEVGVSAVSPDYFDILRIPLVLGRDFTRSDRIGAEPVVLISETLARQLWPDANAIGQRLRTGEQPAARSPLGAWRTVVGIVKDVRQNHTDGDFRDIYIPFFQSPNQYAPVFIQTDRSAAFWLTALRTTLAELDSQVLISGVTSLEDEGDRLVAATRFLTSILTGFSVFAAFLAALGIYGVTASAVQQREHEVAIRIALGATAPALIKMFLREGGLLLLPGIVFGILAARGIASMLANQLYGIQPFDSSTFVLACALMAAVALIATWWPARRGAAGSPIEALKEN
jgi:putative ABC transport system permease protein